MPEISLCATLTSIVDADDIDAVLNDLFGETSWGDEDEQTAGESFTLCLSHC